MSLQPHSIRRCSIAAFWFGVGAIGCGIVAMATLNPVLFQIYLATTFATFVGVIALRWRSGGPLNGGEVSAWVMPVVFLALAVFLLPVRTLVNN